MMDGYSEAKSSVATGPADSDISGSSGAMGKGTGHVVPY